MTKCAACGRETNRSEVLGEYHDLIDQCNALGMESCTEREQSLIVDLSHRQVEDYAPLLEAYYAIGEQGQQRRIVHDRDQRRLGRRADQDPRSPSRRRAEPRERAMARRLSRAGLHAAQRAPLRLRTRRPA